MSLSFLNPFAFGLMVVVAVGTVAYSVWSANQQQTSYSHSRSSYEPRYSVPPRRNTLKKNKKKKGDDICSICLDHLNEGTRTLSCDHCFHNNCLTEWMRVSRNCPLCRNKIEQ